MGSVSRGLLHVIPAILEGDVVGMFYYNVAGADPKFRKRGVGVSR